MCAERIQPRARARLDLVLAHGVEPGAYLLVTAHRAGNVDDPARLAMLVELLLALRMPIVLPLHPRTRRRLTETGLLGRLHGSRDVRLTEPLGYIELTALLCNAAAVLTDSGGLQKEAYLAGIRCVTLRRQHRVGRDARARLERAGDLDCRRSRRRSRRRRRRSGRRSTATATPASAWSMRSCDPLAGEIRRSRRGCSVSTHRLKRSR